MKVDNKRHAEDVPTQIFDWWNYGGITRDVKLIKVPPVYLEDYNLQLTSLEGRRLSFSVKLNKPEADHTVTLSIPELKIKKTIKTAADGTASINMKAKPQLWCPENPKRYQVDITLDNSTIGDSIGFRMIETRGKQILLNGQPIFLKMRRNPTVGVVPTVRRMLTPCSLGQRNWGVTSCAWPIIHIMNIWYARRNAWVSWCGRRFLAIGRLPGRILRLTRMPATS